MQRTLGHSPAVAAPASAPDRYEHSGIPVWRFGTSPKLTLPQLWGDGDPEAARSFGIVLDKFRPEIVHLHGMTSAISVLLAAEAVRREIPIVFNYHTPTVSCVRGTLLRWGTEICDGVLDARICSACSLTSRGVSRAAASLTAGAPAFLGRALARSGLSGGVWTALRTPELTALRIDAFHRMMSMVQRVFALCNWSRELLIRNAIPGDRIVLCRQGIVWTPVQSAVGSPQRGPALRFAFLGRLDTTKGAPVIVKALRSDPGLPVQIDIYGVSQGDAGLRHGRKLAELIGSDERIRLLPPLRSTEVVPALTQYDALLVPSQWLETGPLVVLEAFAAKTPVIGSDLGGIAELVTHESDGFLVRPFDSAEAWMAAFQRLADQPSILDAWRNGIRPPRHARQAAEEIDTIYDSVSRRPNPLVGNTAVSG